MNLYNRAEKYKKYYFWDFGMVLTGKGLSTKEIKCIVNEIEVKCALKKELPEIKLLEIIKIIKNEERLNSIEKQDLINKLPTIIESMRLERYVILIKDADKDNVEKYLIQRGFYPVYIEDTFNWKL